eukprot:jgi/Ulvmu1/3719/UM171_0003.1
MNRHVRKGAVKRKPKRTALHPITNDDLSHRSKSRKVELERSDESVDVLAFAGGVLCEFTLTRDKSEATDTVEKLTAIETVEHSDQFGRPSDVKIRGRVASGTLREATIDYWGWHDATGMRVTDLSLMLASEAIKFVPAQGSPGSASDQVRRIDASKNNAGITVAVHLLPAAMGVQCPEAHAALSTLLRLLLSIPDPAGKQAEMHASEIFTGSHFNASALYGVIKPHGNEPMLQGDVDGLVCTLRPFQRRSVQWMLSREQCASLASSSKSTPQQRNSLFKTLPVIDSACVTRKIFVNQLTGQFQLQPPAPLAAITGGCLCEEMGLGKTVEVIACILRHPCPAPTRLRDLPDRIARIPKKARIACMPCGTTVANPHDVAAESYNGTWVQCDGCAAWMHGACIGFRGEPDHLLCGECLRKLAQQEVQGTSKATLIVCPDAILKQWQSEIARHGAPGALKVIVYGGQSASCTSSLRGAHLCACCASCACAKGDTNSLGG